MQRSLQAFDDDFNFVTCTHRRTHQYAVRRSKLSLTRLDLLRWSSKLRGTSVTLKTAVYKITNAYWLRKKQRSTEGLRRRTDSKLKAHLGLPDGGDLVLKIVKPTVAEGNIPSVYVTLGPLPEYSTSQIALALESAFRPAKPEVGRKVEPVLGNLVFDSHWTRMMELSKFHFTPMKTQNSFISFKLLWVFQFKLQGKGQGQCLTGILSRSHRSVSPFPRVVFAKLRRTVSTWLVHRTNTTYKCSN